MFKNLLKITAFLFLFTLASTSYCQIKAGLSGGINLSNYKVSNPAPEAEFSNKSGFSINAIGEYAFTDRLSVRILAGYTERGGKNNAGFGSTKINYNYLEFAPYVTYKIINSNISTKIMGGFSFNHLLNATAKNENRGEFQLDDGIYLSNITGDFGLEIEVPVFLNTSIIINGIYSLGLKDISKVEDSTLKTRDFQIGAGILYNFL